jgi:hypothetical protein
MIAYHGTHAENVQFILDQGFRPGSWFAKEPIDALIYGGPCIFSVWFCDSPLLWSGEFCWQFHTRDWHETKCIKEVKFYFQKGSL